MKNNTLYLTRGALIAALYVALTYISALFGLSSGAIQFRISEMLCILPVFMPEAIIGVTVGCLISNIICGGVFFDILFGTLATLIGALLCRLFIYLPKKLRFLASIPTVISNSVIVPLCADTNVSLVHLLTQLLFFGRMVHWHVWKKEKNQINYYLLCLPSKIHLFFLLFILYFQAFF